MNLMLLLAVMLHYAAEVSLYLLNPEQLADGLQMFVEVRTCFYSTHLIATSKLLESFQVDENSQETVKSILNTTCEDEVRL